MLVKTYGSAIYGIDAITITTGALATGLVEYSNYLMETKKVDSAKATINFARMLLPADEKVQAQFDELNK